MDDNEMKLPALGAHLKGVKASKETTQGLIEVQKFLAVNGPRGTYSHACMSRADPLNRSGSRDILKERYCELEII